MEGDRNVENFNNFVNKLHALEPLRYSTISAFQFPLLTQCLVSLLTLLYNSTIEDATPNTKFIKAEGQLIKQLSKILQQPQPAAFLMQFNFRQFYNYCQDRGQLHLGRHSKGIYPLVNGQQDPILMFLPFSEQLNGVCGNRNWRLARKVLSKRYESIKQSLSYPHRLSYALLLVDKPELFQYFKEDLEVLWVDLYSHYIQEGLKLYSNEIPQFKPFELINDYNIEPIFLTLINLILRSQVEQFQLQHFLTLIHQQYKDDQMANSTLISIIYKIAKFKNFKLSLPSDFEWERNQFFNRIFLTDEEIKNVYSSQQLTTIPLYDYGPQLMSFICLQCLKVTNINQIDFRTLNYVDAVNRVNILTNSEQLGEKKGSQILNILSSNKIEYVKELIKLRGNQVQKFYDDFLKAWALYYKLYVKKSTGDQMYSLFTAQGGRTFKDMTFLHPTDKPKTVQKLFYIYVEQLANPTPSLIKVAKCDKFQQLIETVDEELRDKVWSSWASACLVSRQIKRDLLMKEIPNRQMSIATVKKVSQPIMEEIILD